MSKRNEKSDAWAFLEVPFCLSALSICIAISCLVAGLFGASPEWVAYNFGASALLAVPSLMALFIMALVIVWAEVSK